MKELNLATVILIALVTSCFLQVGAQLFALSVVASTIAEAPPRSFAILDGEYGYDSSAFWNTVPLITLLLFVIALITNWKSPRRKFLLVSLTLFLVAGIIAGVYLEPLFAGMIATGYSDKIDPVLQTQAARWLVYDWIVWGLGLLAGLFLLLALLCPLRISNLSPASKSDKEIHHD